jgi:formate hydrogenlyase transcriptional activator
MQRPGNISNRQFIGAPVQAEHTGAFLEFARRVETHSSPDLMLRALPAELCQMVTCGTMALIYVSGSNLVASVLDGEGCLIDQPGAIWHEELWQVMLEQDAPVILPSLSHQLLDRTAPDPSRDLPETIRFFRECGNQSVCVLPVSTALRRLGALCIGRPHRDAFSVEEVGLLSLLGHYAALAIDDRLNFVQSEEVKAQLEQEQIKLKLILDLNNSVVSNLELRDVLQSVSPGIRKAVQVDGVALILPESDGRELQIFAMDFPDANAALRQDLAASFYGSIAGQVFRSGKAWVGDAPAGSAVGAETLCVLPLLHGDRVLGVLCLVRTEKIPFLRAEQEFLWQIAGQVAIAIDNALAYRQVRKLKDKLTQEKLYLEDELRSERNFQEIIGNSSVLRRVLRQVEAVAPTGSTVLIYGETGTGKELIARAVHNLSQRRSNPFVKLNCAAIPTGLLESELFGHERGAFTGAIAQRIGRFELASQGTIFLDEIGEIPLDLQPKLLRVLQEKEFERLGGSRTLSTHARLIAATNRDLHAMVEEEKFRSDLFYRLNVFPIHVPPLRERPEDIPFLVRHFAQYYAFNMSKQIDTISSETMNALVRYPWPGNIRELQNVIERAVILSKGPQLAVALSDLKPRGGDAKPAEGPITLEEMERRHILSVLEQTNWVFGGPKGAAARLGIKRPTLQFRMQKLGISRPPRA